MYLYKYGNKIEIKSIDKFKITLMQYGVQADCADQIVKLWKKKCVISATGTEWR